MKMRLALLLVCGLCGVLASPVQRATSRAQAPTQGQPWPMPKHYAPSDTAVPIDVDAFEFLAPPGDCDILQMAFKRYFDIIFGQRPQSSTLFFKPRASPSAIRNLKVETQANCGFDYPRLESDESYQLTITPGQAVLKAKEVWGAIRGLETFSQIVYQNRNGEFVVNVTTIDDKPRYPYRGVLLDTSRHYLSVKTIKLNLDAMAMNKMNVFHWHIVDDPSFPYQSSAFPELSNKGAFDPVTHVYTLAQILDVLEYARRRGIRVIPELDTPGHTSSWNLGMPGIDVNCYNGKYQLNPANQTIYPFLEKLFTEIANVFPDSFLHLGGDEVDTGCWYGKDDIQEFMKKMHISDLGNYYFRRLLNITDKLERTPIVWHDIDGLSAFDPWKTVVEVWSNSWWDYFISLTQQGFRVVLAGPWYISDIVDGVKWPDYYNVDPGDFKGTAAQKERVIGGEANLWGEYVDDTNMMNRLWPRALAVSERLWSPETVNNATLATPRFEEMRCRMVARGLQAQPVNGPGFCPKEFLPSYVPA